MHDWLADALGDSAAALDLDHGFHAGPQVETRTHAKIDAQSGATGTTDDGDLFMTAGLDFGTGDHPLQMAARIGETGSFSETLAAFEGLHSFGGERRLARWRSTGKLADDWSCPQLVADQLERSGRVRMVLSTPGIFADGWQPGWLQERDGALEGRPPAAAGTPSPLLRLVGAVVPRWLPLSGWSLKQPWGPKPIRRLAAAGSVYFFEIVETGELSHWVRENWLRSVSDDPQARRDGFGLALWGTWAPHS